MSWDLGDPIKIVFDDTIVQQLPVGAEIFRANGDVQCKQCSRFLRDHPKYQYPHSDNHAVRGCDGRFYHL